MSESESLYRSLIRSRRYRLQVSNAALLRGFDMRQLYSFEVRQGMLEPEAETQTRARPQTFSVLL